MPVSSKLDSYLKAEDMHYVCDTCKKSIPKDKVHSDVILIRPDALVVFCGTECWLRDPIIESGILTYAKEHGWISPEEAQQVIDKVEP